VENLTTNREKISCRSRLVKVWARGDTASYLPEDNMVTVEFASSLRRHVACPAQQVVPSSLRAVLEAALAPVPELAHYVFDDQRCVRKHVAVFVNQTMVQDRVLLDQPLAAGDRVLVAQALTGG
jgi:molybdopterin converting factor small subunit